MFWKKQEPETITLYHYEIAEITDELVDGETTDDTNWYCSWCGDPPDDTGSHGMCPFHQAQVEAQSAARRERRRNS